MRRVAFDMPMVVLAVWEPLSRTMLLQLGVGLEMGWRHNIEVIMNSEVKRYEH